MGTLDLSAHGRTRFLRAGTGGDAGAGGGGGPADPSAYWADVASDTPVRMYRLDELSGTVAADTGSDGSDGTYLNSPTFAAALTPFGSDAVDLNGSNQAVTAATVPLTGEWSAEAWVFLDAHTIRGIVGCWNAGSGNQMWSMSTWDGPLVYLFVHNGGYSQFAGSVDLTGGWNHVVVVRRDGTNASSIYIDGAEIAVGTIVAGAAKGASLTIGFSESGYLDGRVAAVAVYDYGLTAGRVLSHYTVGTA